MAMPFLDEWLEKSSGYYISNKMFGVNMISRDNHLADGSPYREALTQLHPTMIRYPGGTVTEDLFDPNSLFFQEIFDNENDDYIRLADGTPIATVRSVMEYGEKQGKAIQFVLPTEHLLLPGSYGERRIDESAINNLIHKLKGVISGEYGQAHIAEFEIGNEFFVGDRLSPGEYGSVLDSLIGRLDSLFNEYEIEKPSWKRPKISVQVASGPEREENYSIIEKISTDNLKKINGLIVHFYPREYGNIGGFDNLFGSVSDWANRKELNNTEITVSEWNVRADTYQDLGLFQASGVISIFHELASRGVDVASVWPAQHHNVKTSLMHLYGYNNKVDPDDRIFKTELTPSGYIFQHFVHNLSGLTALNLDPSSFMKADDGDQLEVRSFGSKTGAEVFLSSRSTEIQSFQLDLEEYFSGNTYVYVKKIGSTDNLDTAQIDESDYSSRFTIAEVRSVDQNSKIYLEPGEILNISVSFKLSGITYYGYETNRTILENEYKDYISGTKFNDTIFGGAGEDIINGVGGENEIYGGTGSDRVNGALSSDFLSGGPGDDLLSGSLGNDLIFGGAGNDRAIGSIGNDVIDGGSGSDTISGGPGNDTLFLLEGQNLATGGSGSDTFYISVNNDSIITDFTILDGDRFSFYKQYVRKEDIINRSTLIPNQSGGTSNLVIEHLGGSKTTFLNTTFTIEEFVDASLDFESEFSDAVQYSRFLNSLGNRFSSLYLKEIGDRYFNVNITDYRTNQLLYLLDSNVVGPVLNSISAEAFPDVMAVAAPAIISNKLLSLTVEQFSETLSELSEESSRDLLNVLQFSAKNLWSKSYHALKNAHSFAETTPKSFGTSKFLDTSAGQKTLYSDQGFMAGSPYKDYLHGDRRIDTKANYIFAGSGDDLIKMSFQPFKGTIAGHYARGEDGSDTFYFEITAGMDGVCIGRLGDFDHERDQIRINGDVLDLFNLPSWARVVKFNGAHNDTNSESQQWLVITRGKATVFYSLEGARVDMNNNGLSNGGAQEAHFVRFPPEIRNLKSVDFTNPFNVVPVGFEYVSGKIINDVDSDRSDVTNKIHGTSRDDAIAGGLNGDNISSGNGNDYVWGGSGFDYVDLGTGNDVGFGNGGDDTLHGGDGADQLKGGVGSDRLLGGDGPDYLYGGDGVDLCYGGFENDSLFGGDEDDKLFGGSGADNLYGAAGSDVLYGNEDRDFLTGGDGGDTLYGNSGNDRLIGGFGRDRISGGDQDDELRGNEDHDFLYGGTGFDQLYGGSGNDSLSGGDQNDLVYGEDGDDKLVGGLGNDELFGGIGLDRIFGDDQDDVLYGNEDRDLIYGGSGNDSLFGDSGNDFLEGGAGSDQLSGGDQDDVLKGNGDRDRLVGGLGNDRLIGGSGNDRMAGGEGKDQLLGGGQNDFIMGNGGSDRLIGRSGNDRLFGGSGVDQLRGGSGRDKLAGGNGNDNLLGNTGNDKVFGGLGRDKVVGGGGKDKLFGGAGSDIFVFENKDSGVQKRFRDTIGDFGKRDKIDFRGIDGNLDAVGNQKLYFSGESPQDYSVWFEKHKEKYSVFADLNGDSKADFAVDIIFSFRLQDDYFIF